MGSVEFGQYGNYQSLLINVELFTILIQIERLLLRKKTLFPAITIFVEVSQGREKPLKAFVRYLAVDSVALQL